MSLHPEPFSPADIRVSTPDDCERHWAGTVEASGPQHVRVRLHPTRGATMPRWARGFSLYCAMGAGDESFYAEGTVLKQEGSVLWIGVPAIWDQGERRLTARAHASFDVNLEIDGMTATAKCIDVSAGGLRLPPGCIPSSKSLMTLSFTLPGDSVPIRTEAAVIRISDGDIGVKFVRLRPADGVRIASFCRQ